MDADRIQPDAAPGTPPVVTSDPAATLAPAAKAPRTSPAAQILGALVSSAHADDSVKNQFVAMRSAAAMPNIDADFDALIGGTKPAPGVIEGAAKAAQPATPAAPAPSGPLAMQLTSGQNPLQPLAAQVVNGAKAVATDVAKGIVSTPKQIIGGVLDYGNNLVKFADTIVKHAEDAGLPNVYFQLFDDKGKWAPSIMSSTEFRAAEKAGKTGLFQVPTTGDPDTITGNIVRTGTTFLIGRGTIAGKGAGAGANVLADVVSGATSMDPNSPRLSNIIDSVAPNAVTDFLKAKPEDEGTFLGHIKSGLEMGGIGTAVSGVIRALKATKTALAATPAPGAEAAPAGATGGAADASAAPAATDAGTPAVAPAGEAAAKPQTALDHLLAMKDDLPWEPAPAAANTLLKTGPFGPGPEASAVAGAKAAGGVAAPPSEMAKDFLARGYPAPESGHPLAPAGESATVQVSPELKGRFETYMAQERGELPAPMSEKPLADMRSADFSATGANPVKVNLNAINGPDDLKDAIARVSSQIPAQAVRHNDAVLEAAQSLGMDSDAFLAGPGRTLSDTEVVGLRMVVNDVARQSLDYFKAAALPGAGDEAKAAALATYAKFNDMIAYTEGAKTESGRSTQAWGIKVAGLDVPYAEAVKRVAETSGEPGTPEFMERMAALDSPEQVASAAQAARSMTSRDWMLYGYTNALLSPRTIVKKGLSDTFMALWNVATRYAAERIGSGAGVASGEAAVLANGYKDHFASALAYAQKSFLAGKSQFNAGAGNEFFESFDHQQALAGSAPQLADETPTMAMGDFLRSAVQFKSLLPTTWVGAVDDFATFLNYRTELGALAYRSASSKGLEGADLEARAASLRASPPNWLHGQAVQAAMQNTFKEPLTGWAASMQSMVDEMNIPVGHGLNFELPVGRIVAPFIKIPTNIARWSYTNSPMPLLLPSSRISAELAAGGASRDLALARIGLGTALSTTMLGMTLSGTITGRGPSDPQLQRAWRAAGNEPNSLKIGDKQYSYNSVEPVGMLAGIIADTHDIMRFAKEEDAGTAALSLVFGTGEALMSKTYLEGIANLFKAIQNPDAESAPWFDRLVSSAVPNTIADVQKAMDPWMRQHYHLLDTIEAKLPYFSQGLPPQRTLWGDAIPVKDGYAPFLTGTDIARGLSPVSVGPSMDAQPIDKWIWDNRMAFPRGPENKLGLTKPGLVQTFHGGRGIDAQVELTPEQHDRFQVLAGNELKDPASGLGARDTLNALVDGKARGMQSQWDKASPAEQALIVQGVVNKFRGAAKQQLLREFPDIQEAVSAGWQARADALQPH